MEESLAVTLLVVFIGITFIPLIAKRLKIPVIVAELVFGIALGVSFLDLVHTDSIIDFFASFGLVYLMFLAGLEIDFNEVKRQLIKTIFITLASLVVPFLTGYILASYMGIHPLILGTIFSTTSLGLILPLLKELNYKQEYIHSVLGSVVLVDIISIFLLAFTLTYITSAAENVVFIYSLLAIGVLFLIPWIISRPKIGEKIKNWLADESHFELEVRVSFALIFILSVISEELGFHSIIGAFIAGLIISQLSPKRSLLDQKLSSFGYGFFIPLFFIFMGAKVNIPAIFSNLDEATTLLLVVIAAIGSNVLGVALMSKLLRFGTKESIAMGFFHATLLSLTIAAAEVFHRAQVINENTFSMLILLALVSAIICPAIGKYIIDKITPPNIAKFRRLIKI